MPVRVVTGGRSPGRAGARWWAPNDRLPRHAISRAGKAPRWPRPSGPAGRRRTRGARGFRGCCRGLADRPSCRLPNRCPTGRRSGCPRTARSASGSGSACQSRRPDARPWRHRPPSVAQKQPAALRSVRPRRVEPAGLADPTAHLAAGLPSRAAAGARQNPRAITRAPSGVAPSPVGWPPTPGRSAPDSGRCSRPAPAAASAAPCTWQTRRKAGRRPGWIRCIR